MSFLEKICLNNAIERILPIYWGKAKTINELTRELQNMGYILEEVDVRESCNFLQEKNLLTIDNSDTIHLSFDLINAMKLGWKDRSKYQKKHIITKYALDPADFIPLQDK